MANNTLSYDFQNQVRDFSDVFVTVVQNNPVLSRILTVDNNPFRNTKLEWLNDYDEPLSWTVNTAYTVADGVVTTADTTGLKE